jgi:hypothetical protein
MKSPVVKTCFEMPLDVYRALKLEAAHYGVPMTYILERALRHELRARLEEIEKEEASKPAEVPTETGP